MPAKSNSLSEQLTKIAPQIRQSRSLVRPVSQLTFQLVGKKSDTLFSRTIKDVLPWVSKRSGRSLPKAAWAGESFELEEVGSQHVIAVTLNKPRYWTIRLDDADKEVAQRIWTTEVGMVIKDEGTVLFGARLVSVIRGEDALYERSIPGFVRQIIQHGDSVLDNRPISQNPWIISDRGGVKDLIALLKRKGRENDVVVFSLPDNSDNPSETVFPINNFCQKTLGACHVAIITSTASYILSDLVGRELSVFMQAVRTYKPGFDPNFAEPYQHPLGLPHRISQWEGKDAAAYEQFLIDYILQSTVTAKDIQQSLPSLSKVRQIAAKHKMEAAKKSGSSDKELLDMAMEENQRLENEIQKQRNYHESLLGMAEAEKSRMEQQVNEVKAREFSLRKRIQVLESQPNASQIEIPDTLEHFESWCQGNLTGSVELLNRAVQAVKKSKYEDESLIYKSLLLLRDYYVPMRRSGGTDLKQKYDEQLAILKLEESPSITAGRLGEEGEEYKVIYGGKARTLERHIKNGNSREPRYCFRLYFFWDDESETVVVGWLPSHLHTRAT